MQRRRIGKTWLVVALASMLILSCYIASREVARQWLSVETQNDAQQKLLDYIGEVRRALKHLHHLPNLVTNNPENKPLGQRNQT